MPFVRPHLPQPSLSWPLLALAVVLPACAPAPPTPPVRPAVYVSPVVNDTGAVQRRLSGSVSPRVEAELGFRTGGKVIARLVDPGQSVRAGQPMARLDPGDVQLALQAAIELQRAAQVDATQAASDAARFQRLLSDGSVGAADAERKKARAEAAAARLEQAHQQVGLARNRAGYTVLTAPFDGVVTAVRFESGQLVNESQPVLSLARPGELEVVVDVPDSLVAGLKDWQASLVLAPQGRESASQPMPLKLRELAPAANTITRTTRARFALATVAPSNTLRMGMTADVLLQQPGRGEGADLPATAVLMEAAGTAKGPSVWLVDAQTGALQRQAVQLLSQTTDRVRLSGLPEGAWVVTVGAQKLDTGMTVQPVQRPLVATGASMTATAVIR
jgi:RND family efflux transporter MFP subunit